MAVSLPGLLPAISLQVPDGSVVALVSKQVTAYNAVNNSTVSRTSASKYGEFTESFWGTEGALSSSCHDGSTAGRRWMPRTGSGEGRGESGQPPGRNAGPERKLLVLGGALMQEQDLHPPKTRKKSNLSEHPTVCKVLSRL